MQFLKQSFDGSIHPIFGYIGKINFSEETKGLYMGCIQFERVKGDRKVSNYLTSFILLTLNIEGILNTSYERKSIYNIAIFWIGVYVGNAYMFALFLIYYTHIYCVYILYMRIIYFYVP